MRPLMDWIPSAFTKPPSCSVGHALHFLVCLPSAVLASRPAPTSRRAPHIRVRTRACTFQPILFNSHPCTFCLKCSSPDSLALLVPGSVLAPVTSSRQPSLTYSGLLPQHHTHPTIKICTTLSYNYLYVSHMHFFPYAVSSIRAGSVPSWAPNRYLINLC